MDYSSIFEERLYEHVSKDDLLFALALLAEDTPICDTCHQYGNLGFMINAHQWVKCPACNSTEKPYVSSKSEVS